MTPRKPKDRTVEDVIAAFIAGETPKRDRRSDGVTTRTNYSGGNTRGYPSKAALRRGRKPKAGQVKPDPCTYQTTRDGVVMVCELRKGHEGPHVLWAAAERQEDRR